MYFNVEYINLAWHTTVLTEKFNYGRRFGGIGVSGMQSLQGSQVARAGCCVTDV